MFFSWLGDWLVKYRGVVLGVIVVLTIASALMVPRLEFDFRMEAMLDFSQEESDYAEAFKERFDTQDNVLLVMVTGDEDALYTTEGIGTLHALTEHIEGYDGVIGTYSLTRVPSRNIVGLGAFFSGGPPPPLVEALPVTQDTVDEIEDQVGKSRLIQGNLISEDGSTAVVIVSLDENHQDPNSLDPIVSKMEAELPGIVAEHDVELSVHFGGLPYVRLATIRELKSEQLIMWPVVGLAYFLLILLVFRRVFESAMPLIAVGLATLWTVGLAVALGISVNMINNTLPTMILVVGVCNAIHVMSRILEERRAGKDRLDAIRGAVSGIGLASLLTTLTTAIGFGALVVAHATLLREFGMIMGFGVMLTYAAIIIVLPVFATFLKLDLSNDAQRDRSKKLGDWIDARAVSIMRHPWPVLACAVAVLFSCIYVGTTIPVDSRVIEVFDEGHPVVESNRIIEEKLGGILPLEVDLKAAPGTFGEAEPLRRIARFQNEVQALEGVLGTMSIIDLLMETGMSQADGPPSDGAVANGYVILGRFQPDALRSFANEDQSNIRLSVRMPDDGIIANLETIDQIRILADDVLAAPGAEIEAGDAAAASEANRERGPPIEYRITGQAYLSAVGLDTFVRDLGLSLLTATAVIFVVLVLVFRSIRVGLLSLLPNLIPLAITLAAMPLFEYELNTTTVVVFCIGIGLAVDNCIHIIARFRQESRRGANLDEAIRTTLRTAGLAIITSNLLLIGGFSVLFVSDFDPIQRVARLTITTIGAGLITSLVVLPAELVLFGRGIRERRSESA